MANSKKPLEFRDRTTKELIPFYVKGDDVQLSDGKDLPTKLAEMQDAIEDAGSGDGTVTGVKIGSTTYEPTDGVVDLSSPMGNKVDKNGTDSLMTAAEHTKLAGIDAGAQVNVINSISVNGTPVTPNSGNVNISVEGAAGEDGITPHIGSNGNWWIGPETDPNNDTDIKAQGPAGTSITDADLVIGNALNGQGDVLGMSGAMMIKNNLDFVYGKLQALFDALGNIAFWEGKPANLLPQSLDWSVPKKTVTLALTLSNAVVKYNGDSKSNNDTIQVDEGSGLTLTVEPASGYALTGAPTVSTGATVTDNGNGTYSVSIASVDADMTLSISATGATSYTVTANLTDCTLDVVGQVTGSYSGQLTAKSHSTMDDAYVTVKMGGTDITSTAYNASTGEIEIDDVTDDIEVNATAVAVKPEKWLVSAGNSYCDLGFLPTATMSYRLLYKFTDISQYGRNVAATTAFALPKARTQGGSNWYGVFGTGNELVVPATINTGTEYEFILFRDGDKVMCNGEVIGQLHQRSGVQTSPYAFVHSAALTDASAKLKGSILYIEVFDLVDGVDTLLHRFVPDTQNGANGFLDTVTNTFLPSTSGTAFTIENRLQ